MRLFVAIELPGDVKIALATLPTPIPTARWVKPEHMHLTLRFIGDVAENQTEEIKTALEGVDSIRFDLAVQGIGRFPPPKKKAPRVLWVGVVAQPILMALQARIEDALRSAGLVPEKKAFHPHITLARLKAQKPTQPVNNFLQQQAAFSTPPFLVTRFVLIESRLSSHGPTYTHVSEHALR